VHERMHGKCILAYCNFFLKAECIAAGEAAKKVQYLCALYQQTVAQPHPVVDANTGDVAALPLAPGPVSEDGTKPSCVLMSVGFLSCFHCRKCGCHLHSAPRATPLQTRFQEASAFLESSDFT
jgi:hypothetical protein